MLGDGGLRDAGIASERVDGLFTLPGQLFEDGSAGGIGQGAEDVIGLGLRHE